MSEDANATGWKRRFVVSERAFKMIAFWTTLAGLVVMAVGLQALFFEGAFARFLLLFVVGAIIASVSVVFQPRPEPGFTVELFTRQMCSLCDEARAWLDAKAEEYDFAVWEVDVDEDPDLERRYGEHVPVGVIGDKEIFRLRPQYAAVEREFKRLADARVRGRAPPRARKRRPRRRS